jgi:hypothetical protein
MFVVLQERCGAVPTKNFGETDMPGWREKLALTAQRNRQEIVKARLSRRT